MQEIIKRQFALAYSTFVEGIANEIAIPGVGSGPRISHHSELEVLIILMAVDLYFVVGVAHVGGKSMFYPAPHLQKVNRFIELMQGGSWRLQHAQATVILSTASVVRTQMPEYLLDTGACTFGDMDKDKVMLVGNHESAFLVDKCLCGRR